jgi:hypothetical protein
MGDAKAIIPEILTSVQSSISDLMRQYIIIEFSYHILKYSSQKSQGNEVHYVL